MEQIGPLIAVVDDEANLRASLEYALTKEGYRCICYGDGLEAWEAFREKLPDLLILDIIMPRMDGIDLCRRVRTLSEEIPLMFLTSRDDEFDRVLGLELGADDYLCKPFSMRELLVRVKILLRRTTIIRGNGIRNGQNESQGEHRTDSGVSANGPQHAHGAAVSETNPEGILRCGDLELNRNTYQAVWKGLPVRLTVTEFRILCAIAENPGHVLSRERLLDAACPEEVYVGDRTIDSHIRRIRRKMEAVDPGFDRIESLYGLGYRFLAP